MNWHLFTNKQQSNQYTLIYIAVAAIVAMTISLWIGLQQSVWFDEAYSILVAKQEPAEIIQLAAADVHPPMFYLILHMWGNAWGWSDAPLRLFSALALGGSVVVAGLLTRRLFGDRAAIMSVVFIALAPLLLRYGFEIRMYALASFIGIAATYVLVCARDAKKYSVWLWVLYAVLVAFGMLTLYHLALLWVAHVVWLLYMDRGKLKRFWELPWVWAFLGAVLLFTPWLPKFVGQLGNGAMANIGQPMNIGQLLGVLSFNTLYKPLWQVNMLDTVIILALIVGGVVAFRRVYKQKLQRSKLLLVTCYIAVPILLFILVSFARPLYVERYLSHVAIGLMILAGVLVAGATESFKPASRAVVYILCVTILSMGVYGLAVVGNYNFQRMQKPSVAVTASSIDCTGATVVAADPYVATELTYYLPPTCDMRFYSEWQTMGGGYAPLSGSPLWLGDMNVPRLTGVMYYVYYGEPKLKINTEYKEIYSQTNDGLTLVVYRAE